MELNDDDGGCDGGQTHACSRYHQTKLLCETVLKTGDYFRMKTMQMHGNETRLEHRENKNNKNRKCLNELYHNQPRTVCFDAPLNSKYNVLFRSIAAEPFLHRSI